VKVNEHASGKWLDQARRLRVLDLAAAGLTREEIARECSCSTTSVSRVIAAAGGRPSRRSRRRSRSRRQLTLSQREEIRVGVSQGKSFREIARMIGKHPSTICRELARNGGRKSYRATTADDRACSQMARPKSSKLTLSPRLRRVLRRWLLDDLSPEQISGRLKVEYPEDPEMRISHETIYQSLYVQSRGQFRKDLTKCLRTGRSQRKPRGPGGSTRGRIPGMVNISERPAEVEDRAVPGHWEGDLILGKNNKSFIGTLVERQTRFVMLLDLEGDRRAENLAKVMAEQITSLPKHLRKTLTWDQGKEMSKHRRFSVASGVEVYFCDPHSPWQRGSNENTNGLLRQYFPKGSDLAVHGQVELDKVAAKLNRRPRQTLGFLTPAEKLRELVLR
jgi:IS30 family transposase